MKSAKISELKAKLTSFLRLVRAGETVHVFDRSTPIAVITRVEDYANSQLRTVKATQKIDLLQKLSLQPIRAYRHDIVQTLLEERSRR